MNELNALQRLLDQAVTHVDAARDEPGWTAAQRCNLDRMEEQLLCLGARVARLRVSRQ